MVVFRGKENTKYFTPLSSNVLSDLHSFSIVIGSTTSVSTLAYGNNYSNTCLLMMEEKQSAEHQHQQVCKYSLLFLAHEYNVTNYWNSCPDLPKIIYDDVKHIVTFFSMQVITKFLLLSVFSHKLDSFIFIMYPKKS